MDLIISQVQTGKSGGELIWLKPFMYSYNYKRMQLSMTAATVLWSPVPSTGQTFIWLEKPPLTTENFVSHS